MVKYQTRNRLSLVLGLANCEFKVLNLDVSPESVHGIFRRRSTDNCSFNCSFQVICVKFQFYLNKWCKQYVAAAPEVSILFVIVINVLKKSLSLSATCIHFFIYSFFFETHEFCKGIFSVLFDTNYLQKLKIKT